MILPKNDNAQGSRDDSSASSSSSGSRNTPPSAFHEILLPPPVRFALAPEDSATSSPAGSVPPSPGPETANREFPGLLPAPLRVTYGSVAARSSYTTVNDPFTEGTAAFISHTASPVSPRPILARSPTSSNAEVNSNTVGNGRHSTQNPFASPNSVTSFSSYNSSGYNVNTGYNYTAAASLTTPGSRPDTGESNIANRLSSSLVNVNANSSSAIFTGNRPRTSSSSGSTANFEGANVNNISGTNLPRRRSRINFAQSPSSNSSVANIGITSMSTSLPKSIRESLAAPPVSRFLRPVSTANSVYNTEQGSVDFEKPSKRALLRSTIIPEGEVLYKPWLEKKNRDPLIRWSWWITYGTALLGVAASFLRIWYGMKSVSLIKGNLCLVMEDDFNGDSIDETIWTREVDLSGFGNGEFEMTTTSPNNSFVKDGILYIVPTKTEDVIGREAVFNGYTYNLTGCTNTAAPSNSGCGTVSNLTAETVINPVQSARLTTRLSHSIQYGRVEVRAKISTGDWLWPAIWMLPVDNAYGPWPLSGEIDLMESRGNGINYPDQGVNFVRGSLNWGPLKFLNGGYKTTGWRTEKRVGYNKDWHTYVLEWTDEFLRIYVDSRIYPAFEMKFNVPFFEIGSFPSTVINGSQEIPVPNPWAGRGDSAPFDQPFYLIFDVAAGGTNGWFSDNVGNKPWLDGSSTAMFEFANATDTWYSTWPKDVTERAMAIDYVKMWQLC